MKPLLFAAAILFLHAPSCDAQPPSHQTKLAYVILLDARVDPEFDPTRADAILKTLKENVEALFPGTVVFYVRPLADSATACQDIGDAQDCDRIIVLQRTYRSDRIGTWLRWMKGANRHPTYAPDRPDGEPPLRCRPNINAIRCRRELRTRITELLKQHFNASETAHSGQ